MQLEFERIDWPLTTIFRIAYKTQTQIESVQATLHDGAFTGRGEGVSVSYHGETADSIAAQLASVADGISKGVTRESIQKLLPPGGARNAFDCAFWDLEAKRTGMPAWKRAGLGSLKQLVTAFTLSVDEPAIMAKAASAASRFSLLKLKLTGDGDMERVAAVRAARPDVDIIVDANQSWTERQLHAFTPKLHELKVKLIEQPMPAGADGALASYQSPVPLCADESCQTTASLRDVIGKYSFVNIKLDKTGGLTEALRLAHAAKSEGLRLMVGCMAGSSLSMAPAFIIGQMCDVVDLDGPLLSTKDMPDGIVYEGSVMFAPKEELWG